MQQRRSAVGRPSGTDGSDYSYRMVVDSRYTKVAKTKSLLSRLFFIQGLNVLASVLLILIPVVKGEGPNVFAHSSAVLTFLSLLIGEAGRRHSRTALLKTYLISSVVATLLSVAGAMKRNLISELFLAGAPNNWVEQKVQLFEVAHCFVGVLVQIFAAITTLSLLQNMSPPTRSS